MRRADFATLTEALDYAAQGPTGLNLYGLRGELLLVLPYADLRERARALALRLLAAGLQTGDRVGLIADTGVDFIAAFFACQYAGLIPAPLPLPAPLGGKDAYVTQITGMLSAARAAAVFGPAALADWVQQSGRDAGARLGASDIAELPQASGGDLPKVKPEDTCYLQFSSGSTRFPTGVVVTHKALMANALAITRDGLNVVPSDRAVSWLPLYHDMGLIGFLLSPMCCQMTIDLLPTGAFVRRPLLWLDIIGRNGGTISYSPTFGYELCARRAETAGTEGLDLSKWRAAGVGGDMVRPGSLTRFAERFAAAGYRSTAFVASYGMAEATLALTFAPVDTGLKVETVDVDRMEQGGMVVSGESAARQRSFVRCGPILPAHELEVRDEDGKALPERRVGRVYVRGPSLMQGYYESPEASAAALSADGWLDTGDLGFLIEGELTPTGRAKDLILLNGRNIWPQDLEWTAESEVEGVRSGDVAAFSVPDADDEKLMVLVQCRSSNPDARSKIAEDVVATLRARHGVEAGVRLVGAHALPQTSSGKLFLAGAFDAVEPA